MSESQYLWLHGRFLLDCTPLPVREGVYQAQALAGSPCSEDGPKTVVPVAAHMFASRREAAMHALKTAVRWADAQH